MGNEIAVFIPTTSPYQSVFHGIQPGVEQLQYVSNNLEDLFARPRVAIVGSRKISAYGRTVTARLAGELAKQGVVIVSGLAYGVDSVAHRAALEAGGLTIAVLPSSLEAIYPAAHRNLARQIVEQGGALLSEYSDIGPVWKNQFIERNRIVSGIADALLITEAAINSGTMHTARFALEQGKEVLAVPGNITSQTSEGTNNLLKTGATPVTSVQDVLNALGLKPLVKKVVKGGNPSEQLILDLLGTDIADGSDLLARSDLQAGEFSSAMVMLEITGKIRAVGNNHWAVA